MRPLSGELIGLASKYSRGQTQGVRKLKGKLKGKLKVKGLKVKGSGVEMLVIKLKLHGCQKKF